jgi:hypothetical protein
MRSCDAGRSPIKGQRLDGRDAPPSVARSTTTPAAAAALSACQGAFDRFMTDPSSNRSTVARCPAALDLDSFEHVPIALVRTPTRRADGDRDTWFT